MLKTFFIAEIGINHEGCIKTCKKMIDKAKESGADAVKLQTLNPAEHYAPDTESFKIFKNNMFNLEQIKSIFDYASEKNIKIFSTCGDKKTIDFIDKLNPFAFKVSSGMLEHFPLLEYLCTKKKKIIVSTGMSDLKEIEMLVDFIKKKNMLSKTILMHCVSLYPTPLNKINLNFIKTLEKKFSVPIGFSDHSIGIKAVEVAVSMGVRFIEKHFTLDKSRDGFDHKISIEPNEFYLMVNKCKKITNILGEKNKPLSKNLIQNLNSIKRIIVAKQDIDSSSILSDKNISIMRVRDCKNGINPMKFSEILGLKTKKKIKKFQVIKRTDLLM